MTKLLTIGLLSILTISPLFSDEPYVTGTFEEQIGVLLVDENVPVATPEMESVIIEETTPSLGTVVEEPIEEEVPLEESVSESTTNVDANTPYGKAFTKAKDENKILLIAIRATTCHYCDRMENETLNDQNVVSALDENFVVYHVDQDKDELPMGLQIGMTPNFVFVNSKEDVIDMAPGLRTPVEFLEVLDGILEKSKQ